MDMIPIRLGFSTSYLLRGGSVVVVDCGITRQAGRFARGLEKQGLAPGDVELIILTHGHSDHVGSAAAIRQLT
ncbi:MBL fold metallo-hydrolase, partial [Candidatus Fermentibacterales bacterium]|nr:MBL fold metallo-hydrolase [Candidatus Fermentibacterales bacterium]